MKIKDTEIEVVRGSVLDAQVNTIVNAANTAMRGGGGVDGAIHKAAGPKMMEELISLVPNYIATSIPVITYGYDLPFIDVIHVAGPVWQGGNSGEAFSLSLCYYNCLQVANEYKHESIAFPCISVGVYGFPMDQAANVCGYSIAKFLISIGKTSIKKIVVSCFREEEYIAYTKGLKTYVDGLRGLPE